MIFKKEKNQQALSREEIIDKVFDGRLKKFLRYHKKDYWYQPVYYRIFRSWKKQLGPRRAMKYLLKNLDRPKHVVQVVNIMRTLNREYNYEINTATARLAIQIWDIFSDDEIYDYMMEYYRKEVAKGNLYTLFLTITSALAFKEQKARGFIHVNDFEDFDPHVGHVWSNVDRNFIYPENFYSGIFGRELYDTELHIGQNVVGVMGFTRIEYAFKHQPKKRKRR